MGQHNHPTRQTQIQQAKKSSEPALPEAQQIKATVIGFSRGNCKICFGRGRLGFDARYKDKVHIIACKCVEFFDLETVQKSHEEARAAAEKQLDEQILSASADTDEYIHPCGIHAIIPRNSDRPVICPEHGELCGKESAGKPSSSSSAWEASNSSSGESAS